MVDININIIWLIYSLKLRIEFNDLNVLREGVKFDKLQEEKTKKEREG